MADAPERTALDDLKDAIAVLRRLRAGHSMHAKVGLMVDWVEAEMTYVLDPTSRIIQVNTEKPE